jgi:hypothetical protein
MGNHACGGECLPDPDSSMRLSYPGTDNLLVDLNRASDEKRYKIVYNGEPATTEFKDTTPRKTLNFDDENTGRVVERPFDMSFSQSCIHPAQAHESFTIIDYSNSKGMPLQPASHHHHQQTTSVYRQQWQLTPNRGDFPKSHHNHRLQEGQRHWGTAFEDKENRYQH